MPTAATTKVQAINTMLSVTGEARVNSLDSNLTAEVAMAIDTLDETSKEVQARGWSWNTDTEYTITANSDTKYRWQSDWLQVDSDEGRYSEIVLEQRGDWLWNAAPKKNTNVFAKSTLKVNIIRYLAWETMPEYARRYIMIKAARVFTNRVLAEETRSGYAFADEQMALELLLEREAAQADYNFQNVGLPREIYRNSTGTFTLPS